MKLRLAQARGSQPWFLFSLPTALGLIGAVFYAWGAFGLNNMPQLWASGIYAAQHRYGEATYAYDAGNMAFAAAAITGVLCLILFLATKGRGVS